MYKKKKSKRWMWILLLLIIVAAGGIFLFQQSHRRPETQMEEMVPEENQKLIDVQITKMLGNEMTGNLLTGEQVTGEQKTWLIPVGTEVETRLGTTTTFARLSSGDTIQMLMQTGETEEILKIRITQ